MRSLRSQIGRYGEPTIILKHLSRRTFGMDGASETCPHDYERISTYNFVKTSRFAPECRFMEEAKYR